MCISQQTSLINHNPKAIQPVIISPLTVFDQWVATKTFEYRWSILPLVKPYSLIAFQDYTIGN
jgi:hypothetical protein